MHQLAFLLVGVATASCKKSAPTPSATDLLTAHPWHVVAFTTTANGTLVDRLADYATRKQARQHTPTSHLLVTEAANPKSTAAR